MEVIGKHPHTGKERDRKTEKDFQKIYICSQSISTRFFVSGTEMCSSDPFQGRTCCPLPKGVVNLQLLPVCFVKVHLGFQAEVTLFSGYDGHCSQSMTE